MVAKVEFHAGELFPRVGFIVTNLENMTALGWRRVAVFDADLKEVKEKPTET